LPLPDCSCGVHLRDSGCHDAKVLWRSPGIPGVHHESKGFGMLTGYHRCPLVIYVLMAVEQRYGSEDVPARSTQALLASEAGMSVVIDWRATAAIGTVLAVWPVACGVLRATIALR
jgi:hypothetical protein